MKYFTIQIIFFYNTNGNYTIQKESLQYSWKIIQTKIKQCKIIQYTWKLKKLKMENYTM